MRTAIKVFIAVWFVVAIIVVCVFLQESFGRVTIYNCWLGIPVGIFILVPVIAMILAYEGWKDIYW